MASQNSNHGLSPWDQQMSRAKRTNSLNLHKDGLFWLSVWRSKSTGYVASKRNTHPWGSIKLSVIYPVSYVNHIKTQHTSRLGEKKPNQKPRQTKDQKTRTPTGSYIILIKLETSAVKNTLDSIKLGWNILAEYLKYIQECFPALIHLWLNSV